MCDKMIMVTGLSGLSVLIPIGDIKTVEELEPDDHSVKGYSRINFRDDTNMDVMDSVRQIQKSISEG